MTASSIPEGFKSNPNLHAYLVVSPDKAVRQESAKAMAAAIICRSSQGNDTFCGRCADCTKIFASTHPDCIYISASKKATVKDIREISEEAFLSPNEADCKIFMLEDADEYNVQSQNALLKIIEEPPKNVKFILTASSQSALLPTVRSRVCTITVQNRSLERIKETLRESKKHLGEDAITALSHFFVSYDKADTNELNETLILQYITLAEEFLSGKNSYALHALPKNKEELSLCLQVLMLCCRQIAFVKSTGKIEEGILSRSQLSSCNTKTSTKRALALYDVFEECYILSGENVNVNALHSYIIKNAK